MAHNRQPQTEPDHSSSADEDDEEESSGSEEDVSASDSEVKRKDQQKKNQTLMASSQSAKKPDASGSSESESDEDTQPKKPKTKSTAALDVQPISSVPMPQAVEGNNGDPKSAKKSRTKTSSAAPAVKSGKRPAAASAGEKDSKKANKDAPAADDDSKKLFQRVWSVEDEIAILKGILDYKAEKNGAEPVADMGAFHDFIKKSLHFDGTIAQLADKIRRLRKKYDNNVSKGKKDGKERSFSNSHEKKCYELSKLIWGDRGSNGGNGNASKKKQSQKSSNKGNNASTSGVAAPLPNGNAVEVVEEIPKTDVGNNFDICRFVQYGQSSNGGPILEEEILKAGLELADGSRKVELEKKLKDLKVQEMKLFMKRMELLKEQAIVVLDALNSSGS